MTLKEVIASCLVIALGIILIIHFALFWIYGGVFIYENNKVILALETLMSITIIGFGFERLLSTSNKKYYSKEATATSSGKAQKQIPANQKEGRQAPHPLLQQ